MVIYKFELKHLLRTLVFWLVGLAGILLLLMKGFYPAMMETKTEVAMIFANFPPQVLTAIGIDIDTFFSYEGYYVFTFTYIGLLTAIMAVSVSLQTFAREKRDKCTDFLLTKPVSRNEVFVAKYLACLTVILLFNLFFIGVSALDFIQKSTDFHLNAQFVLYMLTPFLTQLVFLSLGVCYAIFAKRVRSIAGTATAFGIAVFVLSALMDVLDKDILRIIAPLEYFNPSYIFEAGSYNPKLIAAAATVFIGCLVAAYLRYCRHDVAAV